ncbi:MAG: phosphate ABC transporter ATP-binding protein [Deltaproteobacteria bacterium]|nr:phosphate ABC transporter ATP-binding protein [Deltaproteobacteria bacterium]
MSENLAIFTENLNLWYGSFQALKNINLSIHQGNITALIGPSGCGKSTFLRCLNRINERISSVRVSGAIRLFGHDIYGQEVTLEELRKDVGMVFQRPNPLPLSIYENVMFGYTTHYARRSYTQTELDVLVESSLKKVHLWEKLKDNLHDSALGLQLEAQQKLCIARLLPLKPKLILLDEPCSALDPTGTSSIEELLLELKGEYSIVIVTHNMAQARRVSYESIFMLMGEIIEQGSTAEMFLTPQNEKTAQYIEGRFG